MNQVQLVLKRRVEGNYKKDLGGESLGPNGDEP